MEEDLFPRQITNYEKRDDGYFKEVQNQLKENPEVTVQKISEWKDIYTTEIFEAIGGTVEYGFKKSRKIY